MRAVTVRGRAEQSAVPVLQRLVGSRPRIGPLGADGWVDVEVDVPSAEIVAVQVAGLGARTEIVEPATARLRLSLLAAELATLYA